MTKSGDDTFVKVTNADIYKEILELKRMQIETKEHVMQTNGKVKSARWVATTALSLAIVLVGLLFQHLNGG